MNARTTFRLFAASLLALSPALAQVPDAPAAAPAGGASAAQPGAAPKAQATPFGQEVPVFDPGTEVLSFNGKNWNVTNNRVFQARFEKFLNAPEDTSKDATEYRLILDKILVLLAPGNATQQNVDAAFKWLPFAGRYDIDARLCNSLADAVYSVWQAQRNQSRLTTANDSLAYARKQMEWDMEQEAKEKGLSKTATTGGKKAGAAAPAQSNAVGATSSDIRIAALTKRIAEMDLLTKGNGVKRELSELQTKVEFQAMMVQFLMQRRFQHVLMATRFYRALFTDGDTKLNLGKDAADLFAKSTGMPPTVSVIDSMANEMIRDIRESARSFDYLLEKGEMQGATMRLQEAFVTGEFMPELRLLAREKKRKCLDFAQKSYQLISAIDVRDYDRAEKIVGEMKSVAKDFDDSKPSQAINAARLKVHSLIMKAKDAVLNNDKAGGEKALTEAGETWPNNKELLVAMDDLFNKGDVVQKALLEFDQLLSQKNYRQIWGDKVRFIAAVAVNPDRKPTLEKVMKDMETIEGSLMRAEEMARQGNHAGAWESLEKAWAQFPDDGKLNQQRADMTTRASDFVKIIRNAEELEKKEQFGSGLAHYLKAQKLYPASDFARDGVARLVKQVLPEG